MSSPVVERITSVSDLVDLLRSSAPDHDSPGSEAVGQLAHGLQCAYVLSECHPHDRELQAAGLVHDIGHLLVPGDDAGHGRHGADAIRELLGERVAMLVELHVDAKRYLTATDPHYSGVLSVVSSATLVRQGGPMTSEEAKRFASHPLWLAALDLRFADDAAKVPGRGVPELRSWIPLLEQVAETHR